MIKTLITILLIIIGLFCFAKILDGGIGKHERAECIKWEQQSKEYTDWYSTGWQKDQCKQFGIEL